MIRHVKITLQIFGILSLVPATALAQQSLTLTTYYASPTGVFDRVLLNPRPDLLAADCNVNTVGTMYYSSTTDSFQTCQEEGPGVYSWSHAQGVWMQIGDDVVLTDTTNPALKTVSIGTQTPDFMLTMDGDGGIVARGAWGAGKNLATTGAGAKFIWYPKKASIRAGYSPANEWDDANIGDHSVAFGFGTRATQQASTVAGGIGNAATSIYSFIGGGSNNQANLQGDAVSGGVSNRAEGGHAAISGGGFNRATGPGSFVGGGSNFGGNPDNNIASGNNATIPGGFELRASGTYSLASGGIHNQAAGQAAAVVGGRESRASGINSFVGGGQGDTGIGRPHEASGLNSAVIGGYWGIASGENAFVAGGGESSVSEGNRASGKNSAVIAGAYNEASGLGSVVLGASRGFVNGNYSSVIGGDYNFLHTANSSVIGSLNTIINTANTFVGGSDDVITNVPGSFVSVLGSRNVDFFSSSFSGVINGDNVQITGEHVLAIGRGLNITGNNVFAFGANTGAPPPITAINTSNAFLLFPGNQPGRMGLNLTNPQTELDMVGTITVRDGFLTPLVTIQNDPFAPIFLSGGAYTDGFDWYPASSRTYKKNIEPLTTEQAMDTFSHLQPVTYEYKDSKDKDQRVGFIAEDVPDMVATPERKNLSPMDLIGVLTKVVQEQQRQLEEQKQEIEILKEKLNRF